MSLESILVVCVGNICRSPMAQALLARALPNAEVLSAGTGALVGQPADAVARELMASRGLDISAHRGQQVTKILCQRADIVFAMDLEQQRHLQRLYPLTMGKIFRIGKFSGVDVPDPYRQPQAVFEHSLSMIETCVNEWLQRINRI